MSGLYVPLVMIPRFTSYVGQGTYTTAPLDVSEFAKFTLTVWRGPFVTGTGTGSGMSITFEQSDDAEMWTTFSGISAITSANTSSIVTADLTMRWFRVKADMTEDNVNHVVALTCWAIGNLERRERE
jgi:hypothetical protein